jgi:FtsP/CotA-like multicopper oxidase with cupredoxin domain
VQSETLVIAPGERVDAIFTPPGKPGDTLVVDWRLFNRGYGSVEARLPLGPLFDIALEEPGSASTALPAIPSVTIPPIDITGAKEVRVELTLAQNQKGEFEYGINGVPFQKRKSFRARPGEAQVWKLVNTTAWSHPFTCMGSSSRCSMTMTRGNPCARWPGKTPWTCRSSSHGRSPSVSTRIDRVHGCTTVTCSTTPTAV